MQLDILKLYYFHSEFMYSITGSPALNLEVHNVSFMHVKTKQLDNQPLSVSHYDYINWKFNKLHTQTDVSCHQEQLAYPDFIFTKS